MNRCHFVKGRLTLCDCVSSYLSVFVSVCCVVLLWVLDRLIMRFSVFDFSIPSTHCILRPGWEIRITHSTVYLLCLQYAVNQPYGHLLLYKEMRLQAQREQSSQTFRWWRTWSLRPYSDLQRWSWHGWVCVCVEDVFSDLWLKMWATLDIDEVLYVVCGSSINLGGWNVFHKKFDCGQTCLRFSVMD